MPSPLALALAQAGGGQPPPNIPQVAPTNFVQANSDYNNSMEQAYAAKLGQQNAMWGGLAGLGSAGVLTLPKLLSGAGTAASGLAALPYGAAIPGAIGATSVGGAPLVAGGVDAALAGGTDAALAAGADAAAAGGTDALASLLPFLLA
jgi:hypothetical protein